MKIKNNKKIEMKIKKKKKKKIPLKKVQTRSDFTLQYV